LGGRDDKDLKKKYVPHRQGRFRERKFLKNSRCDDLGANPKEIKSYSGDSDDWSTRRKNEKKRKGTKTFRLRRYSREKPRED